MSGWHPTCKSFAFVFGKGSACNEAKHMLIIGKNRVNISLYPACNLICVLSVSCIYSYMYVCVLIVCTLLLGGNKQISLAVG